MIEVHQLTKRYGRHTAVKGISFNVNKGDIVGFLGPNGAGKTTTLRMLTGFLPPSSGSASVAGHDVFHNSIEARRNIGYMPENVPLYDDMRVKEYLSMRGKLKGLSGKTLKTQLGDSLERCGLSHVRRKMIKTLSKGYRQRVGLADALIASPPLLILDEPTNGLDPNQIRQIRQLIRTLGEEHTILISTHILSEVEMIANHVVIIDEGEVKASNSPNNLVESMRSAGNVSVEIRADAEKAISAISALDDVKKVQKERVEDQWLKLSVLVDSGTDARERIASLAKTYNWPLRHLHRHKGTLEEVFVELTRRD